MTNGFTWSSLPLNLIMIKMQKEGRVISTGSVVGGPSFRSTLKRSTVPVEFRFQLAARLDTSRGSATKENPDPCASMSSRERGHRRLGIHGNAPNWVNSEVTRVAKVALWKQLRLRD